MKAVMKLSLILLTVIFFMGMFFVPKTYAEDPNSNKTEIVYENGQWVKYVYDNNGGVIETIIITSN